MISCRLVVIMILTGAALSTAVLASLLFGPRLTRLWRQATPLGRFAFVFAALCATLFAGTKTNQTDAVEGNGGGGERSLLRSPQSPPPSPPLLSTSSFQPSVTAEDLARGWQAIGHQVNTNVCYSMPEGATLATNWWIRGAYEDVTAVSNFWASAWGKIRFALNDTNEIVAVGAPMSAIPFSSRLWSAADSNGAFRITWENFVLGRIPMSDCPQSTTDCQRVSAQIELTPDGDFVSRSNDVETVWRRIDPDDWDGDGYLNEDDTDPCGWDAGGDGFYGPANDLPDDCNSNAYCTISVEVDGPGSHRVDFRGDGPSNYPDPSFIAKPGIAYDVKLLIGKYYDVETDTGIRVVGRSHADIRVYDSDFGFTVFRPVTIRQVPALLSTPAPGLLGAPSANGGFSLSVRPSGLNGVVSWQTNLCCQITNRLDRYVFVCNDGCHCNGCLIDGFYIYEGYSLWFGGIRCPCIYSPHHATFFRLTAPSVVFNGGELKPLYVDFCHGDENQREGGTLTLSFLRGDSRVRIWNDAGKSSEATTFSWDVRTFTGCTYYIEAVEASSNVNDVSFSLVWERPDGVYETRSAATTCAKVLQTAVTAATPGIVDGSPNQQPFAGHTNWNFDVTHSPRPDKHYAVLFRDVVNDDFSVRDFSVRMTLDIQPAGAPVGTARWFPLAPTPQSGSIVSTGSLVGELRNPKVGGVYHIGSCFDGSPTNECNIVLPLAGAEMEGVLRNDLVAADAFVLRSKTNFPRRWYERVWFGWKWFCRDDYGFYRGRPNNPQHPTVRSYNQVRDSDGKGAIGTLHGVPIHIEKLSNLIVAYACRKLGVTETETSIASHFGTSNDALANLSWESGEILADGRSFDDEIDFLSVQARTLGSDKSEKLWPNLAPTTNHRETSGHDNFDTEFLSPGFLYAYP